MSRTKSGSGSILGSLIAIVAVSAVGLTTLGSWDGHPKSWKDVDDDDKKQITLTVLSNPGDRPIDVRYSINGTPFQTIMRRPRWHATLVIQKTDKVLLHTYQETDGDLRCAISDENGIVDDNDRDDIGSIRCYYPSRS